MELILLRGLERVLVVAIGGLSIYLGYRLFRAVVLPGEGSARVELPGQFTVVLSRIGPGVFFALFGAIVVGASLAFPVHVSEAELALVDGGTLRTRNVSGIAGTETAPGAGSEEMRASSGVAPETPELERLRVREHIAFLNQVSRLLDPSLSPARQRSVQRKIRAAKLRLMQGVWSAEWVPFEHFRMWAEGGAAAIDSDAFRQAEEFFNYGAE